MQYVILLVLALAVMIGGGMYGSSQFKRSAPPPPAAGSGTYGNYCMTKEQMDEILKGPTAFSCEGRDYVLAAENVVVPKIYIHAEKKLVLKKTCESVPYYSWYCHPPTYGSLWNNTLWKLKPDPQATIKDGDLFDVYLVKDPDPNSAFICKSTSLASLGPADEVLQISVNGMQAKWVMSASTVSSLDVESVPRRKRIATVRLTYSSGEVVEFDAWSNLLKAFSPDEDTAIYLTGKGLLPESNSGIPNVVEYKKYQITLIVPTESEKKSLQLKTFRPVIPTPPDWLRVYLPESKPVIYLYPESKTSVSVKASPIKGSITISDPPYGNGWEVVADSNSSIVANNATYPYLYYETEVAGYKIPEEGFVFETPRIGKELGKIVSDLGLNQKETNEFVAYWEERFGKEVNKKYMFVGIIPEEEINRVVPLNISPKPKTLLRVRLYFKPLDAKLTPVKPFIQAVSQRLGFTVVEWGGILDK